MGSGTSMMQTFCPALTTVHKSSTDLALISPLSTSTTSSTGLCITNGSFQSSQLYWLTRLKISTEYSIYSWRCLSVSTLVCLQSGTDIRQSTLFEGPFMIAWI